MRTILNYLDETLKFIESDEMREYLRSKRTFKGEQYLDRSVCAEIVSNAPASVESKIPTLDLIASQTAPDPKGDFHDPVWLTEFARHALGEDQKSVPGAVFQVREFLFNEPGYYDDYTLYYEFSAAMRYIKWINVQEDNDPEIHKNANFVIEKYIPGDDGKMVNTFYWITNASGEIWYFGEDLDNRTFYQGEFFNYLGDMNLPVPFESGDIITADCTPFAQKQLVLIIDTGDNADCCAVQCMFITPDGKFDMCAFKHNSFLKSKWSELTHVSVLYRAARYNGILDESEKPLGIISAAIKANPELTKRIDEYFYKTIKHHYPKIDDDGNIIEHIGATWEELKNEFGLFGL